MLVVSSSDRALEFQETILVLNAVQRRISNVETFKPNLSELYTVQ